MKSLKHLLVVALLASLHLPVAVPRATGATILTNVPMQGPMVHVNIRHLVVGGSPALEVHIDPSVPVLTPLAVSHPGSAFDPTHPWHEELDPAADGDAFNRQYGFVLDGTSDPLAEGHGIRIRQVSATPGLLVRRYRQAPPTWEPMFGQGGSPELFEWNLLMFHPACAAPITITEPLRAGYEAFVVDATGREVSTRASFELTWGLTRGLTLSPPRLAGHTLELDAVLPATWNGWRLELERSVDLAPGTWSPVDALATAARGTNVLRDPNPPAGRAFYRARATSP